MRAARPWPACTLQATRPRGPISAAATTAASPICADFCKAMLPPGTWLSPRMHRAPDVRIDAGTPSGVAVEQRQALAGVHDALTPCFVRLERMLGFLVSAPDERRPLS